MALRFKIPWQKWTYFDVNPINCYVVIFFSQYFLLVVIDLINVPCKTERRIGMQGVTNGLCEHSRACRALRFFWRARAEIKNLRANRAKVKVCEQLKILMDHSSPLMHYC